MAEHIDLANRKQSMLDYMLRDVATCAEGIAVMAFYKALHVMEAIFDRDNGRHNTSHRDREALIKQSRRYAPFWPYYRPLWAASTVARYLADNTGAGYSSFSAYLPPVSLKADLLDRYLHPFEKMAVQLLPAGHTLQTYHP
jgi:hypothetical protein